MNNKRIFVFSVVCLLIFNFFQPGVLWAASEEEDKKPEVISLLGKKLYAKPAAGEELLKLQKDLKEAMTKVELNPDDYVEIFAFQNTGGAIVLSSSDVTTYFCIERIR